MTIPLPPLPDSDGSAEANKTPHPGGGYEFDEIPAWSETLVRAIQREAMRVAIEAAIARVESRYAYEAKAMAHHAGTWYAASEYHANRANAASQMLYVLRALEIGT